MPLHYIEEHGFDSGFMRDLMSALLPRGGLYDAQNILFDKPGVARQRLGWTGIFSGSQTAFASALGWAYSADATPLETLHAYAGGLPYRINPATGAATQLSGSAVSPVGVPGRPVRHFGFLIFPLETGVAVKGGIALAGATVNSTFISTVVQTPAAGVAQITLAGPDVTTNIKVGQILQAIDGGANRYYGRVVSIDTSTKFTLWPAYPFGVNITAGNMLTLSFLALAKGGVAAASFQNRLLYAQVSDWASGGTINYDRRVGYSPLPTEVTIAIGGGSNRIGGATFLEQASWPALNYFDSPASDPLVALEPVSDNELLMLTSQRPVVFRGQLITEIGTTDPTVTYDITEIPKAANCAHDFSVVRTPRGVVWTGADGIWCYTGGGNIENLLDGRNATYFRDLARSSTFSVHGAAYVRGHYILALSSGGTSIQLILNLTTKEPIYSRGSNIDIFNALARPTAPSQVFALRWWNTGGGGPSFTNGQTIRLESMFDPYVAGAATTDGDTSVVPFTITTRVITDDPSVQKMFHAGTIRYQADMTAPNITVTAQSKIDASDITAQQTRALGSLSSTATRTITAATNATPIVCTSTGHGLQNQDFVDVDGGTGMTNINGRWRVTVVNANSFSLNGSIGNGAYGASSAVFKRVTEADLSMANLDAGQGVSFTIASSGTVNYFELHGIRLASLQRPMVYSA